MSGGANDVHDRILARLRDPNLRRRFEQRALLHRSIRGTLDSRGFLEVETGQLVDEPGQEPTLDPYFCVGRDGRAALALITSPELRLKQLLSVGAGFERIYELVHCFRSGLGETSSLHEPEFTMLEWYRANAKESDIHADLDALLRAGASALGITAIERDGRRIAIDAGLECMTVKEAFSRFAAIDLDPFLNGDHDGFRADCVASGIAPRVTDRDVDSLFFRVLLERVEPNLGWERPTVLSEYPARFAALARLDDADPRIARRFECYVAGIELANGFDELTDPDEQRRRIETEREVKRASGRDPGPYPDRFLRALAHGMPPACGIALGVDRLLMLLAGTRSITELLAFPHLLLDTESSFSAPGP